MNRPLTRHEVEAAMFGVQHPEMHKIVADVSEATGVSVKEIVGYSRKAEAARARQLAMWKMHKTGASYHKIGKFLCCRDHSTIRHGVKRIEELMAAADKLAQADRGPVFRTRRTTPKFTHSTREAA